MFESHPGQIFFPFLFHTGNYCFSFSFLHSSKVITFKLEKNAILHYCLHFVSMGWLTGVFDLFLLLRSKA